MRGGPASGGYQRVAIRSSKVVSEVILKNGPSRLPGDSGPGCVGYQCLVAHSATTATVALV